MKTQEKCRGCEKITFLQMGDWCGMCENSRLAGLEVKKIQVEWAMLSKQIKMHEDAINQLMLNRQLLENRIVEMGL